MIKKISLLLIAGLSIMAGVAFFTISIFEEGLPDIKNINDYKPSLSTKVFATNGVLIAEFGEESRSICEKKEIPKLLENAFLAAEDKNFYRHNGIDFFSILNAIKQKITRRDGQLRGASTITQQLAKGLLITKEGFLKGTERTLSRKLKEAILALKLEKNLSKDEILWMYLNQVYLGNGSYGVCAAAKNYFRKEAYDLSLAQMALLAGLPRAPSKNSPIKNLKRSLARQRYVLGRMLDEGYINNEQFKEALAYPELKIYERENHFRKLAPFFSEQVRRELLAEFKPEDLYERGLQCRTTLDIDRQQMMHEAVINNVMKIDKRQGFYGPIFRPKDNEKNEAMEALKKFNQSLNGDTNLRLAQVIKSDVLFEVVVIDDGEHQGVIPLSLMNWAREPDPLIDWQHAKLSTVKGIFKNGDIILVKPSHVEGATRIYALEQEPGLEAAMVAIEPDSGYVQALMGGYSFNRSEFNRIFQACRQPGSLFKPLVYAAAINIKNLTPASMIMDTPLTFQSDSDPTWKPKNLGRNYRGEVTLHEAITHSMNVPTINLMAHVGVSEVISFAKKLGVTSELKPELGTALGASCTIPWDMAQVFMTFANLGQKVAPTLIKEILDSKGHRLMANIDAMDPFANRDDRLKSGIKKFFAPIERKLPLEDAYTMHYLLTEVAEVGTGQRSRAIGHPTAGKTGTTNDSFDTLFAGYTKNLLGVVWVGYDQMTTPLGIYEQGGRTALPIFVDFFKEALRSLPVLENLPKPPSMCEARIDKITGKQLKENHPLSFAAPFRCGLEPPMAEIVPENLEKAIDIMGGL